MHKFCACYPKITTLETEVSSIKYIKMMNITILPPTPTTPPHSPLPHPQGDVATRPMKGATRGRRYEVLTAASDSSKQHLPLRA